MKDLLPYLDLNGFTYDVSDSGIITIDGDSYELSEPNRDGYLFDRGFNYIGTSITANNYIYKFGSLYYTLKRGDESKVKLKLLKYVGRVDSAMPTYSFLGIHGPYELLNGSGDYGDWCRKAKFFGVEVLGICEKNTLAGVLKLRMECDKNGLGMVVGETVTVFNQKKDLLYDLKLYVSNEEGWENLLSINKVINVENGGRIDEVQLFPLLGGLVVVLDPKSLNFKDIPSELLEGTYYQLDSVVFDDDNRDKSYLLNLQDYFSSSLLPTTICDAYYLDQEYFFLKKTLNYISGVSNDISRNQYFKCSEEYIMEIRELFKEEDQDAMIDIIEFAIDNTNQIADKCKDFKIDLSHRHLPKYKMTEEQVKKYGTKEDLFLDLILEGLAGLHLEEEEFNKYSERLSTEIDVIKYGDVVDYFLILWDITQWCKQQGILVGFGRGSGCGSLVAYLLGLTHINPFDYDLLFERFLNKGRVQVSLPDLDTDFEMARRPEVKKYMESRYGADQVCSVGTYTTLQVKAAMRDLCRLEGVSVPEVTAFTSKLGDIDGMSDLFKVACQKKDVAYFINKYPEVTQTVQLLHGQPKSKSIHACAMMIYPDEKDMFHWNPIRKQDDMMISEWEGGELDAAGFLKEDILGILQLSKFSDILKSIEEHSGEKIDIYALPLDDAKVFSYFQKGWNGDVFHFGAKGLTGYCKLLKPDDITELVNCIGLYRPGVMEGNFHNEYILRKQGEREVSCREGAAEILQNTRYIMIWQEQTMKMFQVLGGFNLVDADSARRAIGKKNAEKLLPYKEKFLTNYMTNFGVDRKYAEETWKEIENMADYQFNKSHAVAYANTGYACQYLKVHYPLEFWSVAFSYADDDDYPVYLHEINEIGSINILPPDINESTDRIRTDFKNRSLYWSISSVKQVGDKAQEELMMEREKNGPYFSFNEFLDRHSFKGSKVNKSVIENFIMCGAFDKLENISVVTDRYRLIRQYRDANKVKVDKEKDLFEMNPDKVKLEWWYNLRQKKLCGLSFFDYAKLYATYFKEVVNDGYYKFKDFSEISDDPLTVKSENVSVGGYVYELVIRSGKKGDYAIITLEQNYQFKTVVFWSEEYESYEHLLKECKGSILFMNGKTNWDERNQQMVIYASAETEVLILT